MLILVAFTLSLWLFILSILSFYFLIAFLFTKRFGFLLITELWLRMTAWRNSTRWFIVLETTHFSLILRCFLIEGHVIIIAILIIFFLLILDRWRLSVRFSLSLRPCELIYKSFFLDHFIIANKVVVWRRYLSKDLRSIIYFFCSLWWFFWGIVFIWFWFSFFIVCIDWLNLLINCL